jgi:hypothetical protein
MQQQNYAEALPLLSELHEENPDNYNYADLLIDCLIQLKQYDKGITVAESFRNNAEHGTRAHIRLGELYHYNGNEEQALKIWTSNIEAHQNQLQLYLNTAQVMENRREFIAAVEVYKLAREQYQNNQLFFSNIANAYMMAGEYESAIDEWFSMMKESPNQISNIQRSLLTYNDPIVYDIAIIELDDLLSDMSVSDSNYQTFFQLQIWMLQENELFRRALVTAQEYESRASAYNYSLFSLGQNLVDNNEFELAREAFTFYTDRASGEVKWRSLEELANTYSSWAKYIDDYNLDFTNQQDNLYRLAATMLDSIESEANSYSRMDNIQLKKAELALDHVFDLNEAQSSLDELKRLNNNNSTPEINYLEGRIQLAKKEFTQARISFTRANKEAEIGDLAEKTRYFLALTDFYSGDYEFATIQLKSLGRQNTSFYANDALELRLWLQEGQSTDTTGTNLAKFADAVFKLNNGEEESSTDLFLDIVSDPAFASLKDDALLMYMESRYTQPNMKFIKLHNYLRSNSFTPIKEKLLWEKAKLAERIDLKNITANCENSEDCFFSGDNSLGTSPNEPQTAEDLYEQLILEFPSGFYAPYARERLSNLTTQNS